MIERLIKNDLTLRRWRNFKANKATILACWVFIFLCIVSFTAEMWANSKPLYLSYNGKSYFPVFKQYHPTEFAREDIMVMDYRSLQMKDGDFIVWPVIKWDPFETNKAIESYPGAPSKDNWLGTDDRGRDVLSRLIYGFRTSMTFAILVWVLCFVVGTILGGLMGYAGGWLDLTGQRITEILSTVPQFFLMIILVAIFNPAMWLLILISTLFGWISISYYIRAEFLRLRKLEFVESARAIGSGHAAIVFKQILPNAIGPILTFSPFTIAGNIAALAALDYLGFGLPPPTPSWGELLGQSEKYFSVSPWLAIYPSLALFVTLVVLNLIGEGFRDAFSPK